MPKSLIFPNANATAPTPTVKPTATFTGDVYLDRIHGDKTLGMGTVTFMPCALTYWHTHEQGQLLRVLSGSGWICDAGDAPRRIHAGDLIWAPPGTTHWHGADDGWMMSHLAVGMGQTVWGEPVTDEEYARKTQPA